MNRHFHSCSLQELPAIISYLYLLNAISALSCQNQLLVPLHNLDGPFRLGRVPEQIGTSQPRSTRRRCVTPSAASKFGRIGARKMTSTRTARFATSAPARSDMVTPTGLVRASQVHLVSDIELAGTSASRRVGIIELAARTMPPRDGPSVRRHHRVMMPPIPNGY